MRGEMSSNWDEISFRLKISLRYFASSLLVFIWIEVKWNSKWYRYYIGHRDQNEISNRYEILIWTEFTRNEMNKRRVIGYCVQCAYRSFWQKQNFISGDKISREQFLVNRICFNAGLKSQTGMGLYRLSWIYSKSK